MYIGYDPDNIDCLIKDLCYFLDCSIEIIDGKFCVKEVDGFIYDCDSYFGVLKFLLDYANCNFKDIMFFRGGLKDENK